MTVERDTLTANWRCFHCDEVFTDPAEAREHFGADESKDPACKLGVLDVRRFRELEDERDEWQRRALSAEIKAESGEEYYADTMRLTKGHGVFMALDYLEGEKLVLQERVRELEAAALAVAPPNAERELQAVRRRLIEFNVCLPEPQSSRICELGTKCCNVKHKARAVVPPEGD